MQVVKVALAMAAGGLLGCGMRPDPASTEGDLQAAFERREFGGAVRSTDGVDLARVTALHEWADTDPARLADVIRWLAADAPTRSALLAAGAQAHASLDGALANTAPVLRRASEGEPSRHVAPAATDSVLVTAEDIARSPGGAPGPILPV